ncbi:MAG: aldo/keto reductase, partial [Pseudomonadota bacterium]
PVISLGNSAGKMARRTIPATDQEIGIVSLGNSRLFSDAGIAASNDDLGPDRDERARELIRLFLDMGGNLVDASFGSVENLAKILPTEDLQQILFTTSPFNIFGEHIVNRDHVDKLISVLQKKPLDMLQIRNARTSDTTKAYWPLLKEFKEEGLVRHIGTSGVGPNHSAVMEQVMEDGADFVHIDYAIFATHAEERILPAARDTGTAVFTNRPFSSGDYFQKVAGKTLPSWAKEIDCETWAQFNLKWIVGNPAVTTVFMETTKAHRAVENLNAGIGRLPDKEMRDRMAKLIRSFS